MGSRRDADAPEVVPPTPFSVGGLEVSDKYSNYLLSNNANSTTPPPPPTIGTAVSYHSPDTASLRTMATAPMAHTPLPMGGEQMQQHQYPPPPQSHAGGFPHQGPPPPGMAWTTNKYGQPIVLPVHPRNGPPEYGHPEPSTPAWSEPNDRRSGPFGLNPWLLAGIAALIGVILSGAVVGGVLGSMLINATDCSSTDPQMGLNNSIPQHTPTPDPVISGGDDSTQPTPTQPSSASETNLENFAAPAGRNVKSVAMNCPNLNGATIVALRGQRFSVECGIDSQGAGKETAGPITVIVAVQAFTLDQCLDACSSYNSRSASAKKSERCRLVVFRKDLSNSISSGGGNCYLKNATRAEKNAGIKASTDLLLSASLLGAAT